MDEKINYKEVGNKIRIEREKFNLTRERFSEIVELSPVYIGQIERGERKMSLDTLVKVAKSLHLPLDYLIYGEKSINDKKIDLYSILERCSDKELKVIEDVLKAILPHIANV